MQVITSVSEMQHYSDKIRINGNKIAVVPTMGYLHEGHLSLIRLAKQHCDVVITTIFVNPAQFSPEEDFEKYPRDLNRDISMCTSAGCDVVFAPDVAAMYNHNFLTFVSVDNISNKLEGTFRPSHFKGVTTVVAKLFNITKPHVAVFGQKDAQQAAVIKKMVKDLNFDIQIIVAPTVREPDGLAISSRNIYLTNGERKDASVLYKSLKLAEEEINNGENSVEIIKTKMIDLILSKPNFIIDYISFNDADTLEELGTIAGTPVLVSLAARIGKVRLIDNLVIKK